MGVCYTKLVWRNKIFWLSLIVIIFTASCQSKKSELVWSRDFPVIGSQSSPRTADLNGDGVLDIVIGAGKNELQFSQQGILALDGNTGNILWEQESNDQVYGSATFLDINKDGVDDIFIGGRSPHLKALDGKTGKLIWEYRYHYQDHPILKYARFNFNSSVLVPDQNGDDLPDLLVVNGGNAEAKPYKEEDRYPGVLMLINTKSGEILASDTMPDGRESYMSPLFFSSMETGENYLIFGSGGETFGGNLYLGKLEDLANQNLNKSIVIASEKDHGFIAPPVLADITMDGNYDIIAVSHASSFIAIDGLSLQTIWKNKIDGTECSNGIAVLHFTGNTAELRQNVTHAC